MTKLRSPSLLKILPVISSTRRFISSIALNNSRREAKSRAVDDEVWQSLLKGLEHKCTVGYKGYRQYVLRPNQSRVQTLLDRTKRFNSHQEKLKISRAVANKALKEAIEFDDAEIHFPQIVMPMYRHVINGDEESAWNIFRQVISRGQQGEPSASIWHWYIMIGLVARDSTVSLRDVFKLACHTSTLPFKKNAIYRSLKDPKELGGIKGQQRVLAFTLMHNLRKRETEEAYHAVLSVFDSLKEKRISPSSRHVNAMCVSLIYLGRQNDAIQELSRRMKAGPYREDPYGWLTSTNGKETYMNQHTVGMIMFAFLMESSPKRAYEMFKAGISDLYRVPIHCVVLNLLLWAGKQPYEGIASCQATTQEADLQDRNLIDSQNEEQDAQDMANWRSQSIWDGHPSAVQARHIFKTYLFRHHPMLREAVNPLYEVRAGDQSGFLWNTHARMQRWSKTLNDIIVAPLVRWESSQGKAALLNVPTNEDLADAERLIVNDNTFQHYVELLPFVNIFEEVPWEEYILVLAWMKHLGIKPNHHCLLRICWALDHLVPPVAEFISCAGPLHDYLVEWLGEESIPTREEMNAFDRRQRY